MNESEIELEAIKAAAFQANEIQMQLLNDLQLCVTGGGIADTIGF
jgi:hypothetical protein